MPETVHDTDMQPLNLIQRRALQLMDERNIGAVYLELPGASRIELDAVFAGRAWAWPEDVRRNTIIAKMVVRALEHGPATTWKPRSECARFPITTQFYRQKGEK